MAEQVYITEWQADIRLYVNGVERGGGASWTNYSGAGLSAAGAKTRPGGMGSEVELGGPATRGDGTVKIQLSPTLVASHQYMESQIGKGNGRIQVIYLDDEGVVIPGAEFNVTGKLKSAELPAQSFDSPTVGFYTVVLGLDEKSS